MNVKELVEKLQSMPESAIVVIEGNGWHPEVRVQLAKAELVHEEIDGDWYCELDNDDEDRPGTQVVVFSE